MFPFLKKHLLVNKSTQELNGDKKDDNGSKLNESIKDEQRNFCTIDSYRTLEILKEGDCYKICLAKSLHSEQDSDYVVLRMFDKSKFSCKDLKLIRQKMIISLKLVNPGIVQSLYIDENCQFITLVQKYCKRKKFSDLYLNQPVLENEARNLLRRFLKTLSYLKMAEVELIDLTIDDLSVNEHGDLIINCNNFRFTEQTKDILYDFSPKSLMQSFDNFINIEIRSDVVIDMRLVGQFLYYLVSGCDLPEDVEDWSSFSYSDDVTIAFRHLIFQILNEKEYTFKTLLKSSWFNKGRKELKDINEVGVDDLNKTACLSNENKGKRIRIQRHLLFEDLKEKQNKFLKRDWNSEDKLPVEDNYFFYKSRTSLFKIKKRTISE